MANVTAQPLHVHIRDQFYGRIIAGELSPGDRLPTESQIMAQFNVSRGTVTRALRDLEQQGILSRRRGSGTFVKAVAQRHHKNLRHVTMFTPWVTDDQPPGFVLTQVHQALSRMCSQHDMLLSTQCLSARGDNLRDRMLNAAHSLLAKDVRTVLLCPCELAPEQMHWNRELTNVLREGGAKVILFDRDITPPPQRSELTLVCYDNVRGGAILTKHLYDQGYRRIAYVRHRRAASSGDHRLVGYLDGLQLCGLPIDPDLMLTVADTAPDQPFPAADVDTACCDQLIAKADAVICPNIALAASMSRLLTERGVRIGPDMGVAGFDDAPIASLMPVPITVVRQPSEPFAAALLRVVQMLMDEEQSIFDGEQIVIHTELVVRASTRRG